MVLVVVLVSPQLFAQKNDFVLFGGYSYQGLNSAYGGGTNLNGLILEPEMRLGRMVSLVGDFSGGYGTYNGATLRFHNYLFGPRVYARTKKIDLFAHALLGGSHLGAQYRGATDSSNSIAGAIGGGLETKGGRHLSIRFIQVDYLITKHRDRRQDNVRISTGLVLRFK